LEKIGIAKDNLRSVKNTYKRTTNCIKTNKRWPACFETILAVIKGSILLLILFNIIMNKVCNKIKE
jgi:hypothetical protein